jgi:hypothetical protein
VTVRSAHDERRAEEIRATHRRNRKVCAGCGQSWPCTEIAWADDAPLSAWTLRWRKIRAVALIAAMLVTPVAITWLPFWCLLVLFFTLPPAAIAVLVAMSRKRP